MDYIFNRIKIKTLKNNMVKIILLFFAVTVGCYINGLIYHLVGVSIKKKEPNDYYFNCGYACNWYTLGLMFNIITFCLFLGLNINNLL